MSQELSEKIKSTPSDSAHAQETPSARGMDIQEHASLVQAIMLNFPEIYDQQVGTKLAGEARKGEASSPPIEHRAGV